MFSLLRFIYDAFTHAHGAHQQNALKTATYGVMHLVVAMTVAFLLTRDWRAALAIGLIEPLVQTVAYTVHEHLWAKHAKKNADSVADKTGQTPA